MNQAVLNLPLYRQLYKDIDTCVDPFPFLEKKDLIGGFPKNWMTHLLKAAMDADEIEYTSTSGTSGERMHILRRRGWWHQEYARTYRHHSYLKHFNIGSDKKAILTTAVCSSSVCYLENPNFEQRILSNTLYLNTSADPTCWSVADLKRIVDEIDAWRPVYMDADPIYLALFFAGLNRFNIPLPKHKPELLTLSYELSTSCALNIIRHYWDIPTHQLFGSTEAGYLYIEDKNGVKRCSDLSSVEYIPFDVNKNLYSLVVTSYKNEFMPLVRYKTGDIVKLNDACKTTEEDATVIQFCGREGSAITAIQGQIVTQGELDHLLSPYMDNILVYQVVVESDKIIFRYVPLEVKQPVHTNFITKEIQSLFGFSNVITRLEQAISPEPSGKFSNLKRR